MDPRSILVVATRRIGDVLLATPLVRSLRRAYPLAIIDVLVFSGKGEVLRGNPDCSSVIEVAERPSHGEHLRLFARIFRRYELGIATQQSDRSHLYAFLAARRRVGIVADRHWSSAWKRASCFAYEVLDDVGTHTVVQNLRLADRLGIARQYEVVPPGANGSKALLEGKPYAVVHPAAMFAYKSWTQAGWRKLIAWLKQQGFAVTLSGGPSGDERAYCAALAADPDVVDLSGKLSLAELSALLRRARLYVGPDTSVTHLAAACGTPTLALFGPSNPVKWGPWPRGAEEEPSPWRMLERPWQRKGNVLLLQGVQPEDLGRCMPCRLEGCERHVQSLSRCLTEMPADTVIRAAAELLDR
ncbi:MAG TPA: glycosyltransferase family 9 protein [Burkholderiales bacterium]|nr:glycosyltransferase family 9 protein [Burkholderiales bacterium]